MDNEDFDFEDEYNVYERTDRLEHDYLADFESEDLSSDSERTKKFFIFVDAVMRSLNENKIITAHQEDIKSVLSRSKLLIAPKYKNPTGYVLGWWVSQNGTIDKKRLTNVITRSDEMTYPVRPADIIRYANLWLTQLM